MIDLQNSRLAMWLYNTFGGNILFDVEERVIRLGEEVIELGQAEGMTKEQWLDLIEQVYAKPAGEIEQEQGGVMVCIAAYEAVKGADMQIAFETEMARVEDPDNMAKIRAKHAQKPVRSRNFIEN